MKRPYVTPRTLALTLVALLAISGCAAQTEPDAPQATVDEPPAVQEPDAPAPGALAFEKDVEPPTESATQRLVAFEVAWQCDLARFAVDELSELDAILAGHRTDFEVTDAEYAAFQADLAVDAGLRAAISNQTSECLDAGESVQL